MTRDEAYRINNLYHQLELKEPGYTTEQYYAKASALWGLTEAQIKEAWSLIADEHKGRVPWGVAK